MDLENAGKFPYLPEELIEEILSALPAKSLLRFKCVSKSWRCLIGSDRFIKTQLDKSMKDPSYAHLRVVVDFNFHLDPRRRGGLKQRSVRSYLDELVRKNDGIPFDDTTNNHLTTTDCLVVGSCNGLLCILKEPGGLHLWNPTTRISIELFKHDLPIKKCGFGMDEQSGAYKVFAVLPNDDEEYIGKVYSSRTKSWKTVEHGCLDLKYHHAGVLVGGKLHWLRKDKHYIESFDLSSEVFGMIELPEGKPGEDECLLLTESKGRLTLTAVDEDDDDDEEEEWVRVRVRVTKGGAKEHWVKVKNARIDDEEEELKDRVDCYGETFYVESLVWPLPLKNP